MIFFDKLVEKAATFYVGATGLVEAAFSEDASGKGIQHVIPKDAAGNDLLSANQVYDPKQISHFSETVSLIATDDATVLHYGDIIQTGQYPDPWFFIIENLRGTSIGFIDIRYGMELNTTGNAIDPKSKALSDSYSLVNGTSIIIHSLLNKNSYEGQDAVPFITPKYLRLGADHSVDFDGVSFKYWFVTTARNYVARITPGAVT